jgi:hypothetical protein
MILSMVKILNFLNYHLNLLLKLINIKLKSNKLLMINKLKYQILLLLINNNPIKLYLNFNIIKYFNLFGKH